MGNSRANAGELLGLSVRGKTDEYYCKPFSEKGRNTFFSDNFAVFTHQKLLSTLSNFVFIC